MTSDKSHWAENKAAGQVTMIAAAWFARMRSDEKSPHDERRFKEWLEAASEHEAAYTSICDMWEAADGIAETPGIKAMRFAAMRRRPKPRALRLVTAAPRRAAAAAAALAAALVLALGGMMYGSPWLAWDGHRTYRTAPGERISIPLEDGTLVTLTSNSRLIAEISPRMRRVRLERGEAYFDVMHDAERPFVVEAGRGRVTALGTRFDVYKKNGEVVVTLIEGRVQVASFNTWHTDEKSGVKAVELRPGEQVSYDRDTLSAVREVNIERAISWRNGRMQVLNEPLDKVVAEFNRHSKRKMYLDDPNRLAKKILLSGSFSVGRPEPLVEHLKQEGYQVWVVKDSSGNITAKLIGKNSQR